MSKLFISGGTVIDPETLSRFQADVLCEDGRIAAVQPAQSGAPKDARVIDASGCFPALLTRTAISMAANTPARSPCFRASRRRWAATAAFPRWI